MTDLPAGYPAGVPRSSLERVRNALERGGYKVRLVRPTELLASCPVHDDQTPSMHATWKAGMRGGYTVVYCHGCQAQGKEITEALGLVLPDLFDEPLPERDNGFGRIGKSPERRRAGQRRGKLGRLPTLVARPAGPDVDEQHDWVEVAVYPYTTADGRLVQEVVRHECTHEDGRRHKEFRQVFVSAAGNRVHRRPTGFQAALYNAPAVAEARAAGHPIYLLEGEKDVETAKRLGLAATTNAQGGRNFPEELVDDLAGSDCRVVLDRDATGWARGVDLHHKLTAVDTRVWLLLPAVTSLKADFTDHIEAGYGIEDLVRVHVEEVATWHALSAVTDKVKLVDQAIAEANARRELAEEGIDVEENRRFARRWAIESQIRQEAVKELVDRVYGHGLQVGTEWAAAAMDAADAALIHCTEVARRCHLQLGVPVPQSLRALEAPGADSDDPATASLTPETPTSSHPRSHWGADSGGATAKAAGFRILDGQIVQWNPERARRGADHDEDEDAKAGSFKVILSMAVRVTAREYIEVEGEADDLERPELMGRADSGRRRVSVPRTLVAVRLEYVDPQTGESMEVRVMADQWRDHSWLDALPGPPDYDHRRSGLDTLQRAVMAVSDNIADEVMHRATGWRALPDGSYRYIHNRGAITADGHMDGETVLSGSLRRFDLPDPTLDPGVLRTAWLEGSATMLDRVPERVTAPLLGHAFRAVIGRNAFSLALIGPPGSYKTSLAAKVMHHFGELWDHNRPVSSMSGNGDTFNTVRLKLHQAKDVLYWLDDFAPTKSWLEAQKLLEETSRLIHNQEERGRTARDGQSFSDGTPPRATGLLTSEVMPRPGSASQRMLVVPLASDDIDTSLLFPLNEQTSRYQRALVMASFIRWLATDLKDKQKRYQAIASDYQTMLIRTTGESVRQADALASMWSGWVAMCEFLLDVGAISAEEREGTLRRVDRALHEAARAAVNPDMPRTTGARVRELLGYALRQGIAYVDDIRTGDCPPWPLASQLGWRRTVTEVDAKGEPVRTRLDRGGIRLGYVCHDPGPRDTRGRTIVCESTQLEAVLRAASSTQTEKLEIDRNTACRALHDEGVLIPDTSEGRTRHTVKCTIYAEDNASRRMVALRLDQIIGTGNPPAEPEPDGPGGGADGPTPPVAPPELPGLAVAPHTVDAPAPAGHDGLVTTTDDAGPHQPEEDFMSDEPVTTPWVDRDGVEGLSRLDPTHAVAPCILCHQRCMVLIDDVRIHPLCWLQSTTAERQAAGGAVVPSAVVPTAAAQQVPVPRPTAMGTGNAFRAAAAVADVEGLWLSSGERVTWPEGTPGHVGDIVRAAQQLQLGTQVTRYRPAAGQVWVTDVLAQSMGINTEAIRAAAHSDRDARARELTAAAPAVSQALAAGYSIGGRDGNSLGRWTRVWQGTATAIFVVLMAAMTDDEKDTALMAGNPTPDTLARRIGLVAQHLKHPFAISGSTTGLDLMQALRWKDRAELFGAREPIEPALRNIEVDISWSRKPTAEELEHPWVHAYDRSGSYLAGVSGLELGVGDPIHHPDGCAFTPRLPGYWRIEIPDNGDWRMPNPLDPDGKNFGRVRWVTTPGLEFAIEQGYQPDILEAYTWPKHSRILDPWYEVIRDARTALDTDDPDSQVARNQVKQIYAATIGMMGSHTYLAGRPGYAPDRRHHIVAKSRTNILRRVAAIGQDTGRYPVAIIADTVVYTSAEADPVKAWPGGERTMGRELGRYKVEGTATLRSQLEYLTGRGYSGKDALLGRIDGS